MTQEKYSSEIPSRFRRLYSRSQIEEVVVRLGGEISQWCDKVYASTRRDVIALPILRGGIFFFADLVREIRPSVEVCPVRTIGYDTEYTGRLLPELKVDLFDLNCRDRSVLLVDDICDSGRTLRSLSETLLRLGAREVRSAILIRREVEEELYLPEYVGFDYSGPEWFVGYGMEELDRYRNLPDVYIISDRG